MEKKLKISKQDVIDVLKKRWWVMLIEFLVVGIILTLDLVSKEYVCDFLKTQTGLSYNWLPGFIELTYTENTGAGFGIFSGNTVALSVITIIVIVGIMGFLLVAQKQNEWLRISLIFISAGGIGNVVDRLGLGYVRDFIRFSFWQDFAIFNVADAFVTVGAFMLIIVLIVMLVTEGRKNKKEFEKEQAEKGDTQEENLVDPFEQPVNDFLPSENSYQVGEQTENAEQAENVEQAEQPQEKTEAEEQKPVETNEANSLEENREE
ncbi:MAG: signal peptidase II [Clostridia bacterium]|nr:signal peptidase II [Clostridia bacterium]